MALDGDDFSDAPLTLGEVRSDKTRSASDWTPRELLIFLLRGIDSGESPIDEMVVVFKAPNESGFWNATRDTTTAVGLLTQGAIGITLGASQTVRF